MQRGGRRAAIIAGILCLAVGGTAAFTSMDRILEIWYLHRMEGGDPGATMAAGKKLAGIAGRRTIPALLGILERKRERVLDGKRSPSSSGPGSPRSHS